MKYKFSITTITTNNNGMLLLSNLYYKDERYPDAEWMLYLVNAEATVKIRNLPLQIPNNRDGKKDWDLWTEIRGFSRRQIFF